VAIADVSERSIESLISLKGRRAVVTGGAKGLGFAIAKRFVEAGASVVLGDIDEAGAKAGARELADSFKGMALGALLDVRNGDSIRATADLAVEKLGGIDIWVNNAGIFPLTPILEMSDEIWDSVVDVNLRGTFIGCREAARQMCKAGKGGVIINISSTAGFKGAGPGITHYVASKHGVRGITRQLALELASKNIRVIAVAPTTIITEGVKAVMNSAGITAAGFDLSPTLNNLLGRSGVPDDVARVVLFCASDLSVFMTGSTLPVDAGELIH
jgi:NAD(P)-dependent dehydrogenase (short-subunit alcohol dehydrogenase family)